MAQPTGQSPVLPATNNQLVTGRNWRAKLLLEFSSTVHGTRLSLVQRNGPLSVQKAFYPEGPKCAHVYLLHPPAGIVSGDQLFVNAKLPDQTHVVLTTPGANRFYRARTDSRIGDSGQSQQQKYTLAGAAILENFPLETLIYDGADALNIVDVHMSSQASYLGWDIVCLGLPLSSQPFKSGRLSQVNRLYIDEKLCYHDRINISGDNGLLAHPAGLAGNNVFGSFIIATAQLFSDRKQRQELVELIRTALNEKLNKTVEKKANKQPDEHQVQQLLSITDINGILVARYLGEDAQQCKALFIEIWHLVRPLCLGKRVSQPRIWLT